MWSATVELAAGRAHKYKYVVRDGAGNVVRWQPGANNILAIRRGEWELEVRAKPIPPLSRRHAVCVTALLAAPRCALSDD